MKIPNLDLPAKSDGTTIRQHTDDLIKNAKILLNLNYINEYEFQLLEMSCEYHDYGKCNVDFQNRLKNNSKFNCNIEIPHNVLSAFFIDKTQCSKEDYPIIFNAVLNHHFYTNNIDILNNEMERIKEKLQDYELNFQVRRALSGVAKIRISPVGVRVKGLLHKCDYSASAGIDIEYKNDFLCESMDNLLSSWQGKGITENYNDMQLFCKDNTDENIIITAPTGMGKTEGSLLWLGDNKGFYILPLRTAINCIYNRIATDILNDNNIQEKVALLHSNNTAVVMEKYEDMDIFDYLNHSKNLSIPLTVSTPDQLFDFVFRYKGYELKLAVLSYSKIIIDEIQSYSAELLAYIIYGIHEIIRVGGKVAIFTATLPPYILDLINKKDINYKFQDFTHEKIRHSVKVVDDKISSSYILDKFDFNENNEKNESNKTLVVCNTVKKAQTIYTELKDSLGEEKVRLLHSKYTQNDRAKLEKEILEDGLTSTKKSIIWVTTQIVEASIDIDFDYIFTELSELNGFFQRLGRCNRKGAKAVDGYNSYVFTSIDNNILVNKQAEKGFIDKDIYELSKKALENVKGILSETEKNNLLNKFFTYENLKNSNFIEEYNKYYYGYLETLYVDASNSSDVSKKFRNIVSVTVIPKEVYYENEDEIIANEDILKQTFNKSGQSKNQFLIDKEKAKQFIQGLCVNVYPYDFSKNQVVKNVVVGRFDKIAVVECLYDDLGYKRLRDDEENSDSGSGVFL